MDTIGSQLRQQRESRGMSLQDVQDATKITAQNLSALEEDRFDSFPNRVYARAFLRDYANFLGLDSSLLLDRYELEWNPRPEAPPASPQGSTWRVVGYVFVALIVVAGLAAAAYIGWNPGSRKARHVSTAPVRRHTTRPDLAELPRPAPITPAKPEPTKPAPAKPEAPAAPPDKLTVSVAALLPVVWTRVTVDGTVAFEGNLAKGPAKVFQGKSIKVRAGMAGAVQLKLNGQLQPPMGTLKSPGEKTFTLPAQPAESSIAPTPTASP